MLNDKSVAGVIGLLSVHLLQSHSHLCFCAWSAVLVLSVGAVFGKKYLIR